VPILIALQTIFSILMLIHCIRTGREIYWWVIVMLPFGELVYFFAVFIDTPEFRNFKKRTFSRPPDLKQLEYAARTSPSVHNQMQLARAMCARGQHDEATAIFSEVLEHDEDNKEALYGLARCEIERGRNEQALPILEKLVTVDMAHSDYSACEDLAATQWACDQPEAAIQTLRELARKSQRFTHKTTLAQYLSLTDQGAEAREVLTAALEDHANSPAYLKRTERRWAKQARALLRTL
jgi:hypothetical protein